MVNVIDPDAYPLVAFYLRGLFDSKETILESRNHEASSLAGKNTRVVLEPIVLSKKTSFQKNLQNWLMLFKQMNISFSTYLAIRIFDKILFFSLRLNFLFL